MRKEPIEIERESVIFSNQSFDSAETKNRSKNVDDFMNSWAVTENSMKRNSLKPIENDLV